MNQCFFENPVPSDKNFKLLTGDLKDVVIPNYDNGSDFIWSGAITGKTGCDSNSMNCKTADCGADSNGSCVASRGFNQPATQAEFTFSKTLIDFYDIEVINGAHMGVSMQPTNATGSGPYDCGAPGSKYPTSSKVGACTWKFTTPSNDYNWVSAGGSACNLDSDCSSDTTCGISFNPGHENLLLKTCGSQIGYWTADQICGITPTYGAPFNC